jgi:hypothetical protein
VWSRRSCPALACARSFTDGPPGLARGAGGIKAGQMVESAAHERSREAAHAQPCEPAGVRYLHGCDMSLTPALSWWNRRSRWGCHEKAQLRSLGTIPGLRPTTSQTPGTARPAPARSWSGSSPSAASACPEPAGARLGQRRSTRRPSTGARPGRRRSLQATPAHPMAIRAAATRRTCGVYSSG